MSNILEAVENLYVSGNGPFGRRCEHLLEEYFSCRRVLLTQSGTAGLEMAALLLDLEPGDEVIVPSFTFPTTASAFALRGAVPVFVDVRPDTLNLDETLIEAALTDRTRAVVPVHYAGVGCEMRAITEIAHSHDLAIVEDAAQTIMATYEGRSLGSFGDLAAVSFHETKNVISGEGGALLINDEALIDRAEIVQEKGTNRRAFFRGEVDKYTWVELGSSFLMSDINAAFLHAQLEHAPRITQERMAIWDQYHAAFADLEGAGVVRRPVVPEACQHNAHIYYLLVQPSIDRDSVLELIRDGGVHAVFHYVPLHSSPAGRRYGRCQGELSVSTSAGARLIRLPLWGGMTDDEVGKVIETVTHALDTVRTGPALARRS